MHEISYGMKILLEQLDYNQKQELYALEESQLEKVDNVLMTKLYNSVLNKAHVDFEDIPKSKGDITKYSGYATMKESLDIIDRLLKMNSTTSVELMEINHCIDNLELQKDIFERAFKLDNSFIQLIYCSMVSSCVEATTLLLTSYIDFVKYPNSGEFTIQKNTKVHSSISFDTIKQFNKSVVNGSFGKAAKITDPLVKESFITIVGGVAAAALVILSIIPLIREAIFYFFYSRMKVSEFLSYQAKLIELNKLRLNNSSRSITERNKIIKKQEQAISFLTKLADRIKVNSTVTTRVVKEEIKKDNKELELPKAINTANTSSALIL